MVPPRTHPQVTWSSPGETCASGMCRIQADLSACLSVCLLSVCLSICLFICLSICLSLTHSLTGTRMAKATSMLNRSEADASGEGNTTFSVGGEIDVTRVEGFGSKALSCHSG